MQRDISNQISKREIIQNVWSFKKKKQQLITAA